MKIQPVTPQSIAAAKAAAERERLEALMTTGVLIDLNGKIVRGTVQ